MANSRLLLIGSGILRRYFGVGAFLKFSYYLFHLPINPVVGPPTEDFDKGLQLFGERLESEVCLKAVWDCCSWHCGEENTQPKRL